MLPERTSQYIPTSRISRRKFSSFDTKALARSIMLLEALRDSTRSDFGIYFEAGDLVLKEARGWAELRECLQLRHQIFRIEAGIAPLPFGLDIDEIDLRAYHLIIRDTRTDSTIATYRVIPTGGRHYSEARFEIAEFLSGPQRKLELGRACVVPHYRGTSALNLLWKGIGKIAREMDCRYLFGSSSIRTLDYEAVGQIYHYLRKSGHLSNRHPIALRPLAPFVPLSERNLPGSHPPLPPLFSLYLKLGAKVCAPPVLDLEMATADFFTVLDLDEMPLRYRKRYLER